MALMFMLILPIPLLALFFWRQYKPQLRIWRYAPGVFVVAMFLLAARTFYVYHDNATNYQRENQEACDRAIRLIDAGKSDALAKALKIDWDDGWWVRNSGSNTLSGIARSFRMQVAKAEDAAHE